MEKETCEPIYRRVKRPDVKLYRPGMGLPKPGSSKLGIELDSSSSYNTNYSKVIIMRNDFDSNFYCNTNSNSNLTPEIENLEEFHENHIKPEFVESPAVTVQICTDLQECPLEPIPPELSQGKLSGPSEVKLEERNFCKEGYDHNESNFRDVTPVYDPIQAHIFALIETQRSKSNKFKSRKINSSKQPEMIFRKNNCKGEFKKFGKIRNYYSSKIFKSRVKSEPTKYSAEENRNYNLTGHPQNSTLLEIPRNSYSGYYKENFQKISLDKGFTYTKRCVRSEFEGILPPIRAPVPIPISAPVPAPIRAPVPAAISSPMPVPISAPIPVPINAPVPLSSGKSQVSNDGNFGIQVNVNCETFITPPPVMYNFTPILPYPPVFPPFYVRESENCKNDILGNFPGCDY